MISKNMQAFLRMIAFSEGTLRVKGSIDGYNVIVGGTIFFSFSDHPRKFIKIREGLVSTAAGRYQILARYYDAYKKKLSIPDFSPESQDKIAIQMIKECNATQDIEDGRLLIAVKKCAHIWASLPGAGYGQRENEYSDLTAAYLAAGGKLT